MERLQKTVNERRYDWLRKMPDQRGHENSRDLFLEKGLYIGYGGKAEIIEDCINLGTGQNDADDGKEPEHEKYQGSEGAVHIRDIFKIREIRDRLKNLSP